MAYQRVIHHTEVTSSDGRHHVRGHVIPITHDSCPVRLKEDPGQPHWYNSVLDNEVVQDFIQTHAAGPTSRFADGCKIESMVTLTVAVPAESGTLCGARIERLSTPGRYESSDVEDLIVGLSLKIRYRRLGKLRIAKSGHGTIEIDSTNVRQFTMGWKGGLPRVIDVEGQVVNSPDGETFLRFKKDSGDMWRVC